MTIHVTGHGDDRRAVARPAGWFAVAWSDHLEAGAVRPLRVFGIDLVLARGESGRPLVFDAYCPHMGAHLGVGGRMCGDDLICPFHAWRWDPQGENVQIPYSDRTNRSRRLQRWSVQERSGVILLWHDPAGTEPAWDPPELPQLDGPEFERRHDIARVAPQMVLETALDASHLSLRLDQPIRFGAPIVDGARLTVSTVDDATSIECFGVGILVVHTAGPSPSVHVVFATPVDDEHTELRSAAATGGEGPAAAGWAQLERDLAIWEHQRWSAVPTVLPDEDAVLTSLREWGRRFYGEQPIPAAEARA